MHDIIVQDETTQYQTKGNPTPDGTGTNSDIGADVVTEWSHPEQ